MPRTTREQWLTAGLELLVRTGPNALTIERLTERLQRTKGSFYHHFQNFPGYKAALLDHIERLGYTQIIQVIDPHLPPQVRLSRLADEVASAPPHEEMILRDWSRHDPDVASLVERLDRERLDYLEALLSDLTHDPQRGRHFARLVYAVYLGAHLLHPAVERQELRRMLGEIERLATLPEEPA